MISDVPTKGEQTIYSCTGEIFFWFVCAGFILINAAFFKEVWHQKKIRKLSDAFFVLK